MCRLIFLYLLSLPLNSLNVLAQQAQASHPIPAPQHISGSIYWIKDYAAPTGDWSTIVVASIGDDGIVIVDGQDETSAQYDLGAFQTIKNTPLRFVINTHCHSDHTFANNYYVKLAPIIARTYVRETLAQGQPIKTSSCPGAALPTITIDGELNLHLNGETVRIISLPAGHTRGDLMVYFVNAKVAHVGDAFTEPAGFVDRSNGGDILRLPDVWRFIASSLPDDVTIIPGHGEPASLSDMKNAYNLLHELIATVTDAFKSGQSWEALFASTKLDPYRMQIPSDDLKMYLQAIYTSLQNSSP